MAAAVAAAICTLALTGAVVVGSTGSRDDTSGVAPPSVAPPSVEAERTISSESIPAQTPAAVEESASEIAPSDAASGQPVPPAEVPTTSGSAEPDVDETDEPDPAFGAIPDDVVPLDVPASDGSAIMFDPVIDSFTRVEMDRPELPPVPTDAFQPVVLSGDVVPVENDDVGGDPAFTAATGCADRCIESAAISTAGGSSSLYDLRVELENPAAVEAYLSLAPIVRTEDGGHLPPFSAPTASGSVGPTWTTSFDLEPATEYHLLVRANDGQGTSSVAGTFTTSAAVGPDDLALPRPCENGCVDGLSVEASDDGTEVAIGLVAATDVIVEYAWSTEQFEQGANGPALVDASTRTAEVAAGGTTTLRLSGLTPATAYSVVVTASDDLGGIDLWVARIATPSPTILAGVDRVHIDGDGDDGNRNRGEIRFEFGAGETYWGWRNEEKLSSNTTLRLGRSAGGALTADGNGEYPYIMVFAGERDGTSLSDCFIQGDPTGDWHPESTITWCKNARTMWSAVWTPSMSLAEIQQLPTCADRGVTNPGADRCAVIETLPNSSDQVSFEAVVWFDLDPLR